MLWRIHIGALLTNCSICLQSPVIPGTFSSFIGLLIAFLLLKILLLKCLGPIMAVHFNYLFLLLLSLLLLLTGVEIISLNDQLIVSSLIFRSIIDIIVLVLVRQGSFINLLVRNILCLLLLSVIHLILQRLLWGLIWARLGLWLLFTFPQSSFAQVSFICLCVLYSLTLRNLHLSLTQLENSICLRDWSCTCSTSPFLLSVLVFLGNFTSHCVYMAWMSLLLLLLL